jgi:hypothetical protein
MLYEYKIQKVINGNNEIKYKIRFRRLNDGWIFVNLRKIFNVWYTFDYDSETYHDTIKKAQDKIEEEIVKDKAVERRRLAKKGKVLEEFKYKMVPNYVPEEQIEKFLTTSKKSKKGRY